MADTEGSPPSKAQKTASALGSVFRAIGKGVNGYFSWIERKNQENVVAADQRRVAHIEHMKQVKGDLKEEIALEEELADLKEKKNAVLQRKRKEEVDHHLKMEEIERPLKQGEPDTEPESDDDLSSLIWGTPQKKEHPRRSKD